MKTINKIDVNHTSISEGVEIRKGKVKYDPSYQWKENNM